MNKYINYDFSGFITAMSHLKQRQDKSVLTEIKNELNKFFKDSECKDVLYTKNTDKMFFGMSTYAILNPAQVNNIVDGDELKRIDKYFLEIDSKLLDIGLTTSEMVAILLHEVGHLVNDTTPLNTIRSELDKHFAETKTELRAGSFVDSTKFFEFAIRDSLRRITSISTKNDQEILADEFVVMCGFGQDLQSGFKKIVRQNKNFGQTNTLLALSWAVNIYKDIGIHRMGAIKTLNRLNQLSGSQLEKRNNDETIKFLKAYKSKDRECESSDNNSVTVVVSENAFVLEEEGHTSLAYRIRRNGLKGMEDDLYEYAIRIKNVETEEDAMLILRQMNSRMSVIDDYLTYGKDLTNKERQRWEELYNKYSDMRDELSKKAIYNKKQYGLWYDYYQIPDSNR